MHLKAYKVKGLNLNFILFFTSFLLSNLYKINLLHIFYPDTYLWTTHLQKQSSGRVPKQIFFIAL